MLGHPYDAKVDLWSVGVILYGNSDLHTYIHILLLSVDTETLFGMAPFASKTFEELEEKIFDDSPVKVIVTS